MFVFALVTTIFFSQNISADTIPNITWIKQEKFAWCWAASSHVLLNYYIQNFSKTQAEIAKTISDDTSQDGDTVPREEIPDCIRLSSKPTPNSPPLLSATFLDRPLTFTELKEYAENNRPFTVVYNYHIRPYYHCVVYGGYIRDSTRIKIIDPDRLRGTKTYINSYKELITGAYYKDIWVASILVEHATSVDEMANYIQNTSPMNLFLKRNAGKHFTIVCNNPNQNIYALKIFNMRGMSLYSAIINPQTTEEFTPALAPGLYTVQAKSTKLGSDEPVMHKPFTIMY